MLLHDRPLFFQVRSRISDRQFLQPTRPKTPLPASLT